MSSVEAKSLKVDEEYDYRVTEHMKHYGPRLYSEPQYVTVKNGQAEFKFIGKE